MSEAIDVGSTLELKLNEFVVAAGTVTEISEGKVYIDIPATRVVMGLKTSLGEPPVVEPEVEHQFAGTVEPEGDASSPAIDEANTGVDQVVNDTVVTNVPPPNPEQAQPVAQTPIAVSNESLRNQALDSSILD